MDKLIVQIIAIWTGVATFIAPDAERQFNIMVLSMLIWFISALFRCMSSTTESEIIDRSVILTMTMIFALIFFVSRATSIFGTEEGVLFTQLTISISTAYYTSKIITNAKLLGVPIPKFMYEFLLKFQIEQKETKKLEKEYKQNKKQEEKEKLEEEKEVNKSEPEPTVMRSEVTESHITEEPINRHGGNN